MLNVACFVQSCLTDADFVIFSNYCLTGPRRMSVVFCFEFLMADYIGFDCWTDYTSIY